MNIKQEIMNRNEVALKKIKDLAEYMDDAYGVLEADDTIDENDALYAFYLCLTDNLRGVAMNLQRAHGRLLQIQQSEN